MVCHFLYATMCIDILEGLAYSVNIITLNKFLYFIPDSWVDILQNVVNFLKFFWIY